MSLVASRGCRPQRPTCGRQAWNDERGVARSLETGALCEGRRTAAHSLRSVQASRRTPKNDGTIAEDNGGEGDCGAGQGGRGDCGGPGDGAGDRGDGGGEEGGSGAGRTLRGWQAAEDGG